MVYADLITGMDGTERQRFDADLHGWSEMDNADTRALMDARPDDRGDD